MASGGVRSGTPGKSYSNRSDLNQAHFTGQQYGQAQEQQQWQRAMPAGTTPMPAATPPATQAPPPGPLPGQVTGLTEPSARPQEPVTAGAASGPGPGPEAIAMPAVSSRVSDALALMARTAASPELAALAQQARGLGQ